MGVFWVPYTIPKQLEAVQQLEKILFIPQEQRKFLSEIKDSLKLRISLSKDEKQKLQDILTKFGYIIKQI
jgi:hypothetical protein